MIKKLLILLLMIALAAGFYYVSFPERTQEAVSYVGNKKLPIYRVKNDNNEISLTFDSAWPVDDIPKILEVLKKNDIKASFFVLGIWVDQFPESVKLIEKEGHDVSCHGYTHKNMTNMPIGIARKEINNFLGRMKEVLGKDSWQGRDLFRAPSGAWNEDVVNLASQEGLFTIQWDVDTLDYKPDTTSEDIINRVVEKATSGSIVLMHNGTKYTAASLDKMIKKLKELGYKFVPVSKLIHRQDYEISSEGEQYNG